MIGTINVNNVRSIEILEISTISLQKVLLAYELCYFKHLRQVSIHIRLEDLDEGDHDLAREPLILWFLRAAKETLANHPTLHLTATNCPGNFCRTMCSNGGFWEENLVHFDLAASRLKFEDEMPLFDIDDAICTPNPSIT